MAQNFDDLDWDDVRVFLGIMRASSLREAASKLRVTHPTARRRLDQLERLIAGHRRLHVNQQSVVGRLQIVVVLR